MIYVCTYYVPQMYCKKEKKLYLGKKRLNKSMPKCSAQSQGPGSGPDSRDATLFRARSLLNEGTHQSADEKREHIGQSKWNSEN